MSKGRRTKWQKELWDAVGKNDLEVVQAILERKVVREEMPRVQVWHNEEAPLHLAAYCGHDSILRHLVAAGASLDSYNAYSDGMSVTPLHFAVYKNKVGTVKQLIELGADPGLSGKWGTARGTPLDFARQRKLGEMVEILRDYQGIK